MLEKKLKILIVLGLIIVFASVVCLLILYDVKKVESKTSAKQVVSQISEELVEDKEILNHYSEKVIYNAEKLAKSTIEKALEIEEAKKKEEEERKKEEENKIITDKKTLDNVAKYYIKVNYQANVVTIYTTDKNGKYTVPCKAMLCSTGSATPHAGVYTIPSGSSAKGTWGLMVGGVYAQYYTRIVGSILFHSVPYTKKDKSALEYWEYDKLGTTASAGCVRLTVQDAKWIYDNCLAGTQVEFYADSNPGPLGKPSVKKISNENYQLRNWDPTDSDSNNPWKR